MRDVQHSGPLRKGAILPPGIRHEEVKYVEEAVREKPMFGVKHLGGRRFVQPGSEYVLEEKARRYRSGRS
jgi:hypothetical protein